MGTDGSLRTPEGVECSRLPDILSDENGALAQMKAQLPLEDEEELEMLDTLVESLHGERLTRVLVQRGDEDFLARRTLVQWLYLTQPDLNLF